ncbi:WD repeat-containing protein 66 [Camponotus floridanus]|uniref:WD repeat-containing protein 66 n=1 Tax=Camponotus floridanus TaxID=104421 RepID=E2AHH1_CAMFO|nr:WD repeat-containing protein 66 [Camponotus floridanus]
MTIARISPDAKQIVTVGNEKCQNVHVWLWTHGRDKPDGDMLACGLENGAIWILHHITLDPLEEIPYKHSSVAVNKIAFAHCADYMAYTDDASTVVVLKKNDIATSKELHLWNLIGKYHSHYLPITDILFGQSTTDSAGSSRFFSLGKDRELIEYDLEHRSVDLMAQSGGEGLLPFRCLVEGERKSLINEMKDLFYYAQILHQGENTTAARIISDTVVIEQIPNLMRAVGYFPTNKEIENIMTEVRYKCIEKITFEEFVRLYVNHRPAFGFTIRQIKEAFGTLIDESFTNMENPTLTREQFIDVLLGRATSKTSMEDSENIGKSIH